MRKKRVGRDAPVSRLELHYNRHGEYPWEIWHGHRVVGRFTTKLGAIHAIPKIRAELKAGRRRSSRPPVRSRERSHKRRRRS